MQQMSQYWIRAMQADILTVVAYAEVWAAPNTAGSNTGLLATLPVVTGSVSMDDTNAVRRQCSNVLIVPSPDLPPLIPQVAADMMFPDGNELVLYKGCRYPNRPFYRAAPTISLPWVNNGIPFRGEVATLGRFLMEEVDIDDSGGALTIVVGQGMDRADTVSRNELDQPFTTSGVDPTWVEINRLLALGDPSVQVDPSTPNLPIAVPPVTSYPIGSDPFASAATLAQACAYELFLDRNGQPQLMLVRDPSTLPVVADYTEGPRCTVTQLNRKLSNVAVPNWIIVTSQGSGVTVPLRADWKDTNPDSPTFIYGTYPTTKQTIQTSLATTQDQVDLLAETAGYGVIGLLESVTLNIRDNPAHEPEDVVTVTRERAGLNGSAYVLGQIDISLDTATPTPTTATGRLVPTSPTPFILDSPTRGLLDVDTLG
ncbi:MAG TPA: hypothetical protein VII76_07015 [Acidimicrobiales bacterium]